MFQIELNEKKWKYNICSSIQNNYEVTTHTLPHFKCIRLVSMRSSYLPFKMHSVGFRAFTSPLY